MEDGLFLRVATSIAKWCAMEMKGEKEKKNEMCDRVKQAFCLFRKQVLIIFEK